MPINGKNSITNLFYAAKREDGTYTEPQPIKTITTLTIPTPLIYRDIDGNYIVDDSFFNTEEA